MIPFLCFLNLSTLVLYILTGVQSLRDSPSCPRKLQFFKLKSAHFAYKFLGIFNVIITALLRYSCQSYSHHQHRSILTFYNINPMLPFSAMSRHWSQFVWFRVFFILLSSYTYVNYYEEMLQTNDQDGEEQIARILDRDRER